MDWQGLICHGIEGKYCTLAMFTTGFKYRCKGEQNCALLKIEGNENGDR